MTARLRFCVNWASRRRHWVYGAMPTALRRLVYAARHPAEHPLHTDAAEGGIRQRAATRLIRSISDDDRARCSSVSPRDQGHSTELLELALEASRLAPTIDMRPLLERIDDPVLAELVLRWPGEYYRLLAALVEVRNALHVVEIGTHRGMGAIALGLCPPSARPHVTTYDIAPYTAFPGHVMRDSDPMIHQVCGDLSRSSVFQAQKDVLRDADVIFIDGPKSGIFEERLLGYLITIRRPDRPRLLIWDDIRLLPMIKMWGTLELPKLDATSLGHWSGTGLALL